MYSLGIDLGSSSVKVAIVEIDTLHSMAQSKYPEQEMKIDSPQIGWAEQNPEDWWQAVLQAMRMIFHQNSIKPSEIKSIGISYQMHGLVCVDKNLEVLRPSIIWCDSRAIQCGYELEKKLPIDIIHHSLFNRPGNFTASKLFWVKNHEPQTYANIHKIMLPGDFISMRMSGEITTTHTAMSEGIFFDFKDQCLSSEMLAAGDFDPSLFPPCGHSFDVLCYTNKTFEKLCGIKANTPISYKAGDQPNNAFALGVIHDGDAAATGGTSGVVYSVSKNVTFDSKSRVNSFAHVNHTKDYHSIGTLLCINGTGILYQWLRSNFFPNSSYQEIEKIAQSIPIGSNGLSVLSFGNGAERMFENSNLYASIHGIDFNRHTASHIARAALEGIAFAFVFGLNVMKELGINIEKIKAGNDNLFQSNVFSQTLANLSNTEISICESNGAIGAAKGAALGAKYIQSIEHCAEEIHVLKTVQAENNIDACIEAYHNWEKNIHDRLI